MSVHRILLRAIAHATEDVERVVTALEFASGSDDLEAIKTEGHFGNSIVILEAALTRNRDIKAFFEKLNGAGILKTLSREVEARTDDDCTMHFRLDKQEAYVERLVLAQGNDFIDCSVKVAAYPARREIAVGVMGDYISDFLT